MKGANKLNEVCDKYILHSSLKYVLLDSFSCFFLKKK